MTAALAQAGPFEKAGLAKSAGKVLTDQQADQVRGGFRGAHSEEVKAGMQAAISEVLGVDVTGMSREEGRPLLGGVDRSLIRDAMQAAMQEAGIEPPSFNGQKPEVTAEGRKGLRGQRARLGRRQ